MLIRTSLLPVTYIFLSPRADIKYIQLENDSQLLFRTILAAIHFNYNLHRESKVDEKNNSKLKVTYPKFKEGQAVVRKIKVEQNYGKCNYCLKVLAETVSF